MKIKPLFAAIAVVVGTTLPAMAQQLSLNAVSGYLNGLSQAQGEFTQLNGDGTLSTGTFSMKRPGRARFEYNPPDQALVVAGAGAVGIIDKKMKTMEQYPLARTPLKIILDRNVNLGRANMVTNRSYDGTATIITAQDPEHPEYGSIQLFFTADPIQLRKWVIRDDNGATTVILGDLNTRVSLGDSLFNVPELAQKYR